MRTRIALVLGLLAGIVLTGPATHARVPEDPVPAAGAVVTGNGYGHGRGMSQHGAQGAAKEGKTTKQILAFYFPGTTPAQLTTTVRVWLTKDDARTVVRPEYRLRVADLGNGRTYHLPSVKLKAKAWRLSVVGGSTRVHFLSGGKWYLFRTGGRVALKGVGEFRAPDSTVTVAYGGANHVYRGRVRLVEGRTVNVVSLENYLRGVVASEMPATWHPEAVKAQAVAARTYAAFERAEHVNRSYQICDTSACQVYRGVAAEHPETNAAISATAGMILTSGGQPAFTQFSASNGGWSVAGTPSYLRAKADPYDKAYRGWTKALDTAALERAYPGHGALTSVQVLLRDGNGQWGGRVLQVRLNYTGWSKDISGSTLRSLLGLRSTYIQISAPTPTPTP